MVRWNRRAGTHSRRKQTAAAMLCLLWLAFAIAPKLRATDLQEIRYWSLGEITRVVVELDGDFTYKWNRLDDPPRAFFDFPGSSLALAGARKEPGRVRRIEVNDSNLKQIRYAENAPGMARVVLDLAQRCEITASQLANPPRLIVELRGKDAPAPKPLVEVSRSGYVGREGSPTAQPHSPSTDAKAETDFGGATAAANPAPSPAATAENRPAAKTTKASATAPPAKDPKLPAKNSADAQLTAKVTPVDAVTPEAAAPTTVAAAPEPAAIEAPARPAEEPRAGTLEEAPAVAVAKPATRTATGRQSLIRALGLKIGKVVIDPGHGGNDHGTTSPKGIREKDLVLDISRRLAELVEERLGSEVILTRNEDVFVSLEERTAIANRHRADLFLSIHANSSPFKLAAGAETFFLNFTASREAMDVASRENASSTRSVADLQDIVKKIALKDKRDESQDFAAKVQMELFRSQKSAGLGARNRGVKAAPFIVLIGADMPSILVEVGFLSNAKEEAALKTPEHRQKIAEAIFKGVEGYMRSLSHFEPTERAAQE